MMRSLIRCRNGLLATESGANSSGPPPVRPLTRLISATGSRAAGDRAGESAGARRAAGSHEESGSRPGARLSEGGRSAGVASASGTGPSLAGAGAGSAGAGRSRDPPPPPRGPFSPLLADMSRKRVIDRMLRVDHAGEVGARQIYAGQLAIFGGTRVGSVIAHMAAQEQKHLDAFDRLVVERRVRPTVMLPVWNAAGFALGLGTALLGKEAAMACTVAVEEVIAEHYDDQVRTLGREEFHGEDELREMFREFREDELEHKDTGYEHDAERAPMYRALSKIIKAGCRGAIFITERV